MHRALLPIGILHQLLGEAPYRQQLAGEGELVREEAAQGLDGVGIHGAVAEQGAGTGGGEDLAEVELEKRVARRHSGVSKRPRLLIRQERSKVRLAEHNKSPHLRQLRLELVRLLRHQRQLVLAPLHQPLHGQLPLRLVRHPLVEAGGLADEGLEDGRNAALVPEVQHAPHQIQPILCSRGGLLRPVPAVGQGPAEELHHQGHCGGPVKIEQLGRLLDHGRDEARAMFPIQRRQRLIPLHLQNQQIAQESLVKVQYPPAVKAPEQLQNHPVYHLTITLLHSTVCRATEPGHVRGLGLQGPEENLKLAESQGNIRVDLQPLQRWGLRDVQGLEVFAEHLLEVVLKHPNVRLLLVHR
mmetsp:Transcript_47749/g.126340  ORF Transcript_47749/g.126340 Transcript_47749/m.126340 type:complete len:355 (+) Transcript_47749:1713-2777(+)